MPDDDPRCPECDRLRLRNAELCAAVEMLACACELGEGHAAVTLARAAVKRSLVTEKPVTKETV